MTPEKHTKKLYCVTVEVSFYALAEDESEAVSLTAEAVNDADLKDCATAREVTHSDVFIEDGWEDESLVYHVESGDVTLRECLDKLPKRHKQF